MTTIEIPVTDKWEVDLRMGDDIVVGKNGSVQRRMSAELSCGALTGLPDLVADEVRRLADEYRLNRPIKVDATATSIRAYDNHSSGAGVDFTFHITDPTAVDELKRACERRYPELRLRLDSAKP